MYSEPNNSPQIVVHNSSNNSSIIWVLIIAAGLFVLYKTNPTSKDFKRFLINEYAKKYGINKSTARLLNRATESSDLTDMFNDFVERKNYAFFSTYSFEYNNQKFDCIGILNSFIPSNDNKSKTGTQTDKNESNNNNNGSERKSYNENNHPSYNNSNKENSNNSNTENNNESEDGFVPGEADGIGGQETNSNHKNINDY